LPAALITRTVCVLPVLAPDASTRVLAAGGATLTDTLHIAWTMVSGMLMMPVDWVCGSGVRQTVPRVRGRHPIVLLVAFGALTGTYAASVQANLPTPWLGVWERVDAGLLMLWLIVLAVALLRRGETTAVGIAEEAAKLGGHDHWVPPETSVAFFTLTAPEETLVGFERSRPRVRRHEPERSSIETRWSPSGSGVRLGPSRREEKTVGPSPVTPFGEAGSQGRDAPAPGP
jgi:hypothetical protein